MPYYKPRTPFAQDRRRRRSHLRGCRSEREGQQLRREFAEQRDYYLERAADLEPERDDQDEAA